MDLPDRDKSGQKFFELRPNRSHKEWLDWIKQHVDEFTMDQNFQSNDTAQIVVQVSLLIDQDGSDWRAMTLDDQETCLQEAIASLSRQAAGIVDQEIPATSSTENLPDAGSFRLRLQETLKAYFLDRIAAHTTGNRGKDRTQALATLLRQVVTVLLYYGLIELQSEVSTENNSSSQASVDKTIALPISMVDLGRVVNNSRYFPNVLAQTRAYLGANIVDLIYQTAQRTEDVSGERISQNLDTFRKDIKKRKYQDMLSPRPNTPESEDSLIVSDLLLRPLRRPRILPASPLQPNHE